MDALKKLAAMCPWPADRPRVAEPPRVSGRVGDGARELLARELSAETRVAVEIGCWVGLSTRFIADHAPSAAVIAIDHWCGNPEHQRDPTAKGMLPTLYETFLALCWDYRDRLIPLRMTALQGLRAIASQGLHPELIYIDGERSHEALAGELELIRHSFPGAVIIGAGYDAPGIAPAVAEAVRRHGLALETAGPEGPQRAGDWRLPVRLLP